MASKYSTANSKLSQFCACICDSELLRELHSATSNNQLCDITHIFLLSCLRAIAVHPVALIAPASLVRTPFALYLLHSFFFFVHKCFLEAE